MAGWNGWIADILGALKVPNVGGVHNFVQEWGATEATPCKFNPLAASRVVPRSTNCRRLTSSRTAQNYASRAQGVSATVDQLRSGNFPHLLAALEGQTVWEAGSARGVNTDLIRWGATTFAGHYRDRFAGLVDFSAQPPATTRPTAGLTGYTDLQRAAATRLPTALRRSRALRLQALRRLGAPRNLGG